MEGADLYPSKRLRTQTPAPSPSTKGKEKMEEAEAEAVTSKGGDAGPTAEETCGICLSDGGSSVRGHIDSCAHFFCFICITEWAKVESRCPMCKRRFRSIHRPRARGVCERIVKVAIRDQVYHPHGNESTGLSDSFEHVNCSLCHNTADEQLMLLCDRCDSAVHTYCIGLGATVPEGDWYCPDCTILWDEHSKSQTDADHCNQHSYRNLVVVGMSEPPVSISELLSDGIASETSQSFSAIQVLEEQRNDDRTPSTNTSQRESQDSLLHTEQSSLPTIPAGKTVSSIRPPVGVTSEPPISIFEIVSDGIASGSSQGFSNIQERGSDDRPPSRNTSRRETQDSVLHKEQSSSLSIPAGKTVSSTRAAVEKGARTLHRCRTLQGRIRTLRENWNALRSGSLSFTSSLINGTDVVSDMKQKGSRISYDTSRLSDSTTSVNGEDRNADANALSEKHNRTGSQDVHRAWKMMEIAKSIQGTHGGTNSSLNSYCKKKSLKGAEKLHSSPFVAKGNISAKKVSGGTESDHSGFFSLKTVRSKCKSQHCETQKSDMKTKEKKGICSGPQNTLLSGYSPLPSTTQYRFSPKDTFATKEGTSPHQLLHELPITFDRWDAHADPCSAGCSLPEASSLSLTKPVEFSCRKVGHSPHSKGKQAAHTNANESLIRNNITNNRKKGTKADDSSIRRNDIASNDAKDEVQSLVKLNLTLLRRDQNLHADKFKEVARVATHTILAACGWERSKSGARSSSGSICTHSEQIKQLRRARLMPNSCSKCFYAFVKNAVDSALLEKTRTPNSG